jgi:hypothetical protein
MDSGLQHLVDNEASPDNIDPFTIRDSAMLGMAIGHVGLTVRISVVRTIKAPEFAFEPCTTFGCVVANCKGNCLAERESGGASAGPSDAQYTMTIAHHKCTGRGLQMPPITIQSRKLNALLKAYAEVCRPKVCCF